MKRKELIFLPAFIICFVAIASHVGNTCVGRILNLAVSPAADQQTVGRVLAVFINERTGTTVNLKSCKNIQDCQKMVVDGRADLFISYTGPASSGIEGVKSGSSPQDSALRITREPTCQPVILSSIQRAAFKSLTAGGQRSATSTRAIRMEDS